MIRDYIAGPMKTPSREDVITTTRVRHGGRHALTGGNAQPVRTHAPREESAYVKQEVHHDLHQSCWRMRSTINSADSMKVTYSSAYT